MRASKRPAPVVAYAKPGQPGECSDLTAGRKSNSDIPSAASRITASSITIRFWPPCRAWIDWRGPGIASTGSPISPEELITDSFSSAGIAAVAGGQALTIAPEELVAVNFRRVHACWKVSNACARPPTK